MSVANRETASIAPTNPKEVSDRRERELQRPERSSDSPHVCVRHTHTASRHRQSARRTQSYGQRDCLNRRVGLFDRHAGLPHSLTRRHRTGREHSRTAARFDPRHRRASRKQMSDPLDENRGTPEAIDGPTKGPRGRHSAMLRISFPSNALRCTPCRSGWSRTSLTSLVECLDVPARVPFG
jgi:hypothetical protein